MLFPQQELINRGSFKFYRPVCVVEELLPRAVSLVAEVDMDEGVVLWLEGLLDEGHVGLFWGSASFPDVAAGTGADDVFPGGFSSYAPRDYVVERKLAGGESFSAVLAFIFVAREYVSAIEFDVGPREAVVKEQADDSRDGDVKIDG